MQGSAFTLIRGGGEGGGGGWWVVVVEVVVVVAVFFIVYGSCCSPVACSGLTAWKSPRDLEIQKLRH